MKKILLLFALTIATQLGFSQVDWNADLDFLKTELPLKHKNFFFLRSQTDFNKGLENIKSQIDSLTDFEIIIKIQQLIASFGDSHTRLDWYSLLQPEYNLPIGCYLFSDGLYILKTSTEYSHLIGQKVLKINGYPINEIVDSLNTLITCENNALRKAFFPHFLSSTQLLHFFHFDADGKYRFEVEDEDGNVANYQIIPSIVDKEFVSIEVDSLAYCWAENRTAFAKKYFEQDRILYIMYNSCVPVSYMQTNGIVDSVLFEDFQNDVFSDLKNNKVDKLIFDMRFNGGGNSVYGSNFVKKLATKSINKKGKLFVVIGRETFSSAILNTLDFKKRTKAIVVGEETGGKPNHYGEIRGFELPSSHLNVIYSTKYFKNSESELNTIVPDIEIETSFRDFSRGIDPVFEWIKQLNQ